MPLYEYECDACQGRFEVIQKFSETSETCRVCGKGPVRRLMSSPAIQFKGTGWYITDYAQKGKSGGESGGSAPKDKGEKSDKADAGGAKSDGGAGSTPAKSDAPASPAAAAKE